MIYMTQEALRGLQSYRYKSTGLTWLDHLHQPFWNGAWPPLAPPRGGGGARARPRRTGSQSRAGRRSSARSPPRCPAGQGGRREFKSPRGDAGRATRPPARGGATRAAPRGPAGIAPAAPRPRGAPCRRPGPAPVPRLQCAA